MEGPLHGGEGEGKGFFGVELPWRRGTWSRTGVEHGVLVFCLCLAHVLLPSLSPHSCAAPFPSVQILCPEPPPEQLAAGQHGLGHVCL